MTTNHGLYTDTVWAVPVTFTDTAGTAIDLSGYAYVAELVSAGSVVFRFKSSGVGATDGTLDLTDADEGIIAFGASVAAHANVPAGAYRVHLKRDLTDDIWTAEGTMLVGEPGSLETYLRFDDPGAEAAGAITYAQQAAASAATAVGAAAQAVIDAAAAGVSAGAAATAKTAAELAETNAETAQAAAEAARDLAVSAKSTAESARDAAAISASDADSDRVAAQSAKTAAEAAQVAAELAETNAETARDAAISAKTAAETAETNAETARDAAQLAQTGAETAETNAETAQGLAEEEQMLLSHPQAATAASLEAVPVAAVHQSRAARQVQAAKAAAALSLCGATDARRSDFHIRLR